MNFSQKLGLFILIIISLAYVYFSFFNTNFKIPELKKGADETTEHAVFNPLDNSQEKTSDETSNNQPSSKIVKIFILDKSGNLRPVNRTCEAETESSCFEYAIKELIAAPSKWEKSKGFTSEIPQGTKILSVRESDESIQVDFSSDFETGGGAESTYMRVRQVIKTVVSNSNIPVYLYVNGKQANVIGGEGIMVKQPLNERSLDE